VSSGRDQGDQARVDSMAPESAERLADVLDVPRTFRTGDELPLLWHWAYFSDAVPQSMLAPDGHPWRTDAALERFPRRMAAGGSVRRLGALVVGRPAERHSFLEDLTEKQGRSGPLMFANWCHAIEQGGYTVREEHQTVVYRPSPEQQGQGRRPSDGARAVKEPPSKAAPPPVPTRSVTFDTAMLFRFSAVTWNAHRIHYDWPYATGPEGYPGLVVHGPLLACLLELEARREVGEPGRVDFRALAPIFVDDRVEISSTRSGPGRSTVEARRADGEVAMSLVASVAADELG
jgi:hydroxyacyl-ACP dehydratase HTD2-like protein with hotdog domain